MKNEFTGSLNHLNPDFDVTHGVYDYIVPKNFHIKPLVQPNILFCIEMSKKTIETGKDIFRKF